MRIQTYRMKWAAERYAREIATKFPSALPAVVPYDFKWAVLIRAANGRNAFAGTRPRGYGKHAPGSAGDHLSGTYRLPNNQGL